MNTNVLSMLESEFEKNGALQIDQMEKVAEKAHAPLSQIAGAASFYAAFTGGKMGEVCPCTLAETPLPMENRRILSQSRDYAGLKAAVADPDGILTAVSASGLRGRGGAGFPVGLKWKTTKE